LIYRNGRPWRVIGASYRNEAGETINLLNPYDSPPEPSRLEKVFRAIVPAFAG